MWFRISVKISQPAFVVVWSSRLFSKLIERDLVFQSLLGVLAGADQFSSDRRGADCPGGCIGVLPKS